MKLKLSDLALKSFVTAVDERSNGGFITIDCNTRFCQTNPGECPSAYNCPTLPECTNFDCI